MEGLRKKAHWLLLWASIMALPAARAEEPSLLLPVQVHPRIAASSGSVAHPTWATLQPGMKAKVRVRQVFPCDGLSPAERLLRSSQPIQPGDRFLAEVICPTTTPLPLVVGTIVMVTPPGKFGRPGRLTLRMTQLVESSDGTSQPVPWLLETEDRRISTRAQRRLLTSLMALEGVSFGASLGSQLTGLSPANPVLVTGGAGIGLILGVAYASFRRGVDAKLEQGDTFEIVVGTTLYRPVPRTLLTTLFPAVDPSIDKTKRVSQP
jgi:hypothetical protein